MLLGFGYLYKFVMFYLFIYLFKKQKTIDKKKQLTKILQYFLVFAYNRVGQDHIPTDQFGLALWKTTGISLVTLNFKLQILCAVPQYFPV